MVRLAIAVRPDKSFDDLVKFRDEGYTRAIFVQNVVSDADCSQWNGKKWEIDDLLEMAKADPANPCVIFWITHPNCLCHFVPDPESKKQPEQPAQLTQPQVIPPTTMQSAPPQTKTV